MLNKNQKEVEELSNSSNIIGKGTIVNGSIETFGNIRVEGKVIGDIKTKFDAKYDGPYNVVAVNNNGTVRIQKGAVTDIVNIRIVTPYRE